jgi:hypothetical protein
MLGVQSMNYLAERFGAGFGWRQDGCLDPWNGGSLIHLPRVKGEKEASFLTDPVSGKGYGWPPIGEDSGNILLKWMVLDINDSMAWGWGNSYLSELEHGEGNLQRAPMELWHGTTRF